MTGRVLDHQRLLRDQVLEVVHDERRQTIEGFELLGRASEADLRGCSLTVEELERGTVL